ncbi:hypothetical protein [Streptomyces sp. NBC_00986]|uniref:hypothetical protein n=1 Tax=Streptomyces sp. NBC_00986 TaxID=2903702 RepID=UPI00386FC9A1|nr:hypothetical protein OG504_35655 [Streptomyces sp. NBC_00986]
MSDQRWVREQSRVTWEAMSRREHAAVVRAVRKGEPARDPATALPALHWAWAVIGPPGARRRHPWRDAFLADIYDGTPRNDARRVEAAYLPFTESLDT